MPGRGPDGTATAGAARKRASAASECDAQNCNTICYRVTDCETYVSNREVPAGHMTRLDSDG